MKAISLIILFWIPCSFSAQSLSDEDRSQILQVLEQQRNSWNDGKIEDYMRGYWNSDSLRFIGKSGIKYGWQSTLQSYKKGYPSKEAMGKLFFEVISLEGISEDKAFMIGKWKIIREENNIEGYFTLIWQKISGAWLITTDHSS